MPEKMRTFVVGSVVVSVVVIAAPVLRSRGFCRETKETSIGRPRDGDGMSWRAYAARLPPRLRRHDQLVRVTGDIASNIAERDHVYTWRPMAVTGAPELLIVMGAHATTDQAEEVVARLEEARCAAPVTPRRDATVIGA